MRVVDSAVRADLAERGVVLLAVADSDELER